MSTESRWRRGEDGASSLFALTLLFPVVMLGLMVIFQFIIFFHAKQIAENAAQEGAAASRSFGGTEAQARAQAEAYMQSLGSGGFHNRSVSVTRNGATTTVTVSGTVVSVVPFLHLSVNETTTQAIERYVPPVVNP